jgi:5-methylcytosine-specific restriction endonuclease McrA
MPIGVYVRKPKVVYQHLCQHCSSSFSSGAPVRKFCSRSCQNKAQAKPKIYVTCPQCKTEFTLKFPSQRRVYCSNECFRLHKTRDNSARRKVYRKATQIPMTPQELKEVKQRMLDKQDYVCAICPTSVDMSSCLDHCHESGAPRGVLCITCNTGLGMFKDNVEALRKAALYLETL